MTYFFASKYSSVHENAPMTEKNNAARQMYILTSPGYDSSIAMTALNELIYANKEVIEYKKVLNIIAPSSNN
jgi:hypothetical protein